MTDLLTEAFRKAQDLPAHLQTELAERLIDTAENSQVFGYPGSRKGFALASPIDNLFSYWEIEHIL